MSDKTTDTLQQGRMWLRNRSLRRKLMGLVLILLIVAIVLGITALDGWLSSSITRFAIFWGAVTLYTLLLLMLCCYDILRIRHGEFK